MSRINDLSMTAHDVLVAMSDGNPGAISVMMQMFENTPHIDPDNALGGLGPVMFLDTLGIYGPRIWMLYKDVCNERIEDTLAVLRAVQMGVSTLVLEHPDGGSTRYLVTSIRYFANPTDMWSAQADFAPRKN